MRLAPSAGEAETSAVIAALDLLPPGGVRDVPVDRGLEPALEARLRLPAERALGVAGVDRVAQIVARPVRHEADQAIARAGGIGHAAVEDRADRAHYIEIAAFRPAAEIVLAAGLARRQREAEPAHMILDMQPVPPVL